HLAAAHATEDDHAAAATCWERVVALKPDLAAGHVELGSALRSQGQTTAAAECFRRALELDPGNLDAVLYQGGLEEELGNMAGAAALFRQARVLCPEAPAPLGELANLLRGRLPEADRQALADRLADATLSPRRRSNLLFGQAQVLDADGAYAGAAACL